MKILPTKLWGRGAIPLGRLAELDLPNHKKADRLATKVCGWDYQIVEFSTREEMAKIIRKMENRGESHGLRPIIKLTDGEGY
jgi:hypothetical protein